MHHQPIRCTGACCNFILLSIEPSFNLNNAFLRMVNKIQLSLFFASAIKLRRKNHFQLPPKKKTRDKRHFHCVVCMIFLRGKINVWNSTVSYFLSPSFFLNSYFFGIFQDYFDFLNIFSAF